MTIKSINYQELFPSGSFLNVRYGMEISIDSDSEVERAYELAKELVHETHKKQFPFMYEKKAPVYSGEEPVIAKEKSTKYTQTEILKQQMSTVTDLKVLETYKLLVKNNPELQDYYNHQENFIKNGL
jgi:hypothetical protein